MSSFDPATELVDDETSITEISFLPDGRVCLFGASREIIALLDHLKLGDKSLDLRHLQAQSGQPIPKSIECTE